MSMSSGAIATCKGRSACKNLIVTLEKKIYLDSRRFSWISIVFNLDLNLDFNLDFTWI
jgi:hypothetical protein